MHYFAFAFAKNACMRVGVRLASRQPHQGLVEHAKKRAGLARAMATSSNPSVAGTPAVCPVSPDAELWLGSPESASHAMLHGLDLPATAFAEAAPVGLPPTQWRTVNVPGISVRVSEMVAALGRAGGDTGLLTFEPDPMIEAIVGSWPRNFDTARARSMGFAPAEDIDATIQSHLAEVRHEAKP